MSDDRNDIRPLSREWMVANFGEPHPQEVIDILFNLPAGGKTIADVRAEVLALGEQRARDGAIIAEWHAMNRAVVEHVKAGDLAAAHAGAMASRAFAARHEALIRAECARLGVGYDG